MHRGIALLALVLTAVPPPVLASPSVSLHWQTCTSNTVNRNYGSGPVEEIVVTATGLSGPVQAIGLTVVLKAGFAVLPPAWRFDPEGCEAGHFSVTSNSPDPGCPTFLGANPRYITGFDYDSFTSRGRAYYFTAFDQLVADPSKTYTLARFSFDHSNAIAGFGNTPEACGCLDRALCLEFGQASYLDGAGNEIPFSQQQSNLNWNDPTNNLHCGGVFCDLGECPPPPTDSTCVVEGPTPANLRSWGSVKATYR